MTHDKSLRTEIIANTDLKGGAAVRTTPSKVLRIADQTQSSSYEFQKSSQRCKIVSVGRWVVNGTLTVEMVFLPSD